MSEMVTEPNLARGLAEGNRDAFDQFFARFHGPVFRFSYSLCRHHQDAEEIAQETFLAVLKNAHQLQRPECLQNWVLRITRNIHRMRNRKSKFAPREELSIDASASSAACADRALDLTDGALRADEQVIRQERLDALAAAVQGLPNTYRPVVMLRCIEDLSSAETAKQLNLSVDVVKTRLHRAQMALRGDLRDRFADGRTMQTGSTCLPSRRRDLRVYAG